MGEEGRFWGVFGCRVGDVFLLYRSTRYKKVSQLVSQVKVIHIFHIVFHIIHNLQSYPQSASSSSFSSSIPKSSSRPKFSQSTKLKFLKNRFFCFQSLFQSLLQSPHQTKVFKNSIFLSSQITPVKFLKIPFFWFSSRLQSRHKKESGFSPLPFEFQYSVVWGYNPITLYVIQ